MRKQRFVQRLFLIHFLIILAALVAVSAYTSRVTRVFHVEQVARRLEETARLVSRHIAPALEHDSRGEAAAICSELGRAIEARITVILPSGKVVGDSREAPETMENQQLP